MTEPETPRVLSLSEAAERLKMKRPNVAKFLARHGVKPAFAKAVGYFYWEADIERVKAQREADPKRLASDEKRRQAALRAAQVRREEVPAEVRRLGPTQQEILRTMLRRPVLQDGDRTRLAVRRLVERGLAEEVPGERGAWQLTPAGRRAAVKL